MCTLTVTVEGKEGEKPEVCVLGLLFNRKWNYGTFNKCLKTNKTLELCK